MSTADDSEVEVWFNALEIIVPHIPESVRMQILQKLIDDEAERQRKKDDVFEFEFKYWKLDDVAIRDWSPMMRARSVIAQVLVRSVRNNHSPEKAARLLFGDFHQWPSAPSPRSNPPSGCTPGC
jgi:hypothetical protein